MVSGIDSKHLEMFRLETQVLLEKSLRKQGAATVSSEPKTAGDRVTLGSGRQNPRLYDASLREVGIDKLYQQLRERVIALLQEQGIAVKIATGDGEIDLTSLSQEEAQALVAEDGYFGVEQTSERIFRFAVSMVGDDPERLDQVRKGLEQGFREAEEIWGGRLPEISYQTWGAVNEKFGSWIEETFGRA